MIVLTDKEKEKVKEFLNRSKGPMLRDYFAQKIDDELPEGTIAYIKHKDGSIHKFLNWTEWTQRNLRILGLMGRSPFYYRSMSRDEIIENALSTRLRSWKYASAEELLEDEAFELSTESLNELKKHLP